MLPKYPIKAQNATNTESTDVAVFIVPDGAISGNEVDISGSSDPLVYRALLTQSSTDAPMATVLENTLGGTVVWTRDGAGLFFGTLTGAFTASKTFCLVSGKSGTGNAFRNINIYSASTDVVTVAVQLHDGTEIDYDDSGAPMSVQILVYP